MKPKFTENIPPPKFLKGGEAFLRINYIEGGGVVVKILVQKWLCIKC